MSEPKRRGRPPTRRQPDPKNPGDIQIRKLEPAEATALHEAIRRQSQRLAQEERLYPEVSEGVLEGLALDDWFTFRVREDYAFRVRIQLQARAKTKGWFLFLQEDPTAAPPSGWLDMIGQVRTRKSYEEPEPKS